MTNRPPYIVVTTNGALLTEERYQSLRMAGVDKFSLSFDYPDERHDEYRGIPGLFKRIKSLMEQRQSNHDKVITLSGVIQRDNYKELIKMAEQAREWDASLNFSTYTPLRTNNKDYLIPKEEVPEFKDTINQLLEFKRKYKTIITSKYVFEKMVEFFENESIPNCRAGERFLVVNPDGTLSPCGLIITDYLSW